MQIAGKLLPQSLHGSDSFKESINSLVTFLLLALVAEFLAIILVLCLL